MKKELSVLLVFTIVVVAASMLVARQVSESQQLHSRAMPESSLEVSIFRFLNASVANPVFDWLLPFVTTSKTLWILAIPVWVALIVFGGFKARLAALMLVPLFAASDQLTSHIMKPITMRMRPCEILGHVHLWYQGNRWIWTPSEVVGGFKSSFSFPSSHASNITSSMLFLSLIFRRRVPYPCLAVAVLVSFSRVYIGVHWPSDVLIGMMIGAGLAWAGWMAFKRIWLRHTLQSRGQQDAFRPRKMT